LGGALLLAAQLPTRHGIADIASWLEQEIYRLGVDVRLSSYAEAEDVLAEGPAAVIIATGSMPRMDGVQNSNPGEPISGHDLPQVLSSHDVLAANRKWHGQQVTVLDDTGHYEALGIAEHLVADGASVTFVSPFKQLAFKVENALMVEPVLERIAAASGSMEILLRHRIVALREGRADLAPTHAGPARTIAADAVVLVTPNQPLNALQAALAGKVARIVCIGDALSPRNLQRAIREGHLAVRPL
ncbi:MAG: hypothetical protein RL339_542, partial [Pseudomonadota bacterium]